MHKDSLLEIIQIYTGVLEVHYHSKDSNIFSQYVKLYNIR